MSLPVELLKESYFLHLLATDPSAVIPPGKSLLAMLTHSHTESNGVQSALHDKVQDLVHRAFWDQALQSLSDPLPSTIMARLKLLYTDLQTALTPLLPVSHPILIQLAAPLPPTSSPLLSARALLHDILQVLRSRCAPIRDNALDALISRVDDDTPARLPELVTDTIRDILYLAEMLKDDLGQFVLGSMSDTQLRMTVRQQARSQERHVVELLWSKERTDEYWAQWIGDKGDADTWIVRLVQALLSSEPLSCNLPSDAHWQPANALPPQFLFSAPNLFYLQNYLQAVVITTSLRSLVRFPQQNLDTPGSDFTQRIWSLLKTEIESHSPHSSSFSPLFEYAYRPSEAESHTKLINLADEVIRATRLLPTNATASIPREPQTATAVEEEARLRAAVERTLRINDPVFVLLQARLADALSKRVLTLLQRSRTRSFAHTQQGAPEHLRTGRSGGKRQFTLDLDGDNSKTADLDEGDGLGPVLVKGFEDPVLVQALGIAVQKVWECVRWILSTWGDPPVVLVGRGSGEATHLEE